MSDSLRRRLRSDQRPRRRGPQSGRSSCPRLQVRALGVGFGAGWLHACLCHVCACSCRGSFRRAVLSEIQGCALLLSTPPRPRPSEACSAGCLLKHASCAEHSPVQQGRSGRCPRPSACAWSPGLSRRSCTSPWPQRSLKQWAACTRWAAGLGSRAEDPGFCVSLEEVPAASGLPYQVGCSVCRVFVAGLHAHAGRRCSSHSWAGRARAESCQGLDVLVSPVLGHLTGCLCPAAQPSRASSGGCCARLEQQSGHPAGSA